MALAQARPEHRDATLLRAATALFCQEPLHERDAIRRYEQLAIHLMPKVGDADRAYVASLLAGRHDAPASVIRALARDTIVIAASVLRQSPVLTTIDLLGVIAATGSDHHRIIASRKDIGPDVMRALDLAAPDTTPDGEAAGKADRPNTNAEPASPWLGSEISEPARSLTTPTIDFGAFLNASPAARLKLLGDAAEWQSQARPHGRDSRKRLDQTLRERFAAADLVRAARRGDRAALVAGFSEVLGVQPELVDRFIDDPSGEPLALMARAVGLSDADGRSILLLANKRIGESVDAFFRISDLFASLERRTADAFIDTWREKPARRPAHAPVFSSNRENAPVAKQDASRKPEQRDHRKATG